MKNVLEKFEMVVSEYPTKIAVDDGKTALTFEELKSCAKKYAAVICVSGTDFNEPVGVFVDRTVDSVVMMLAVLYSGNYYIPLDPEMPDEKIKNIFLDSNARVVLGKEENRIKISSVDSNVEFISTVELNENEGVICDKKYDRNDNNPIPLYMVYTSGSTGKPKGVLKSHFATISFINAYTETFRFGADEVIGNQSPLYFDASAKDLYLMLCTGATLILIPKELFTFLVVLIEFMNEKKITFISWVPTALSIIVQMNIFTEIIPKYLKRVFFVGEVMPIKHLKKWKAALPDVQFVNLYGSSELAGICCYYEVKEITEDMDKLPLGESLSNCKVYLLDEDNVIDEREHLGEICVVSDALAIEYFNDKERTQERFQMKEINGECVRVYRTGDIGKYNANGELVYVGRADFQVKHRGHRIELGEIETVSDSMDAIQRSACLYDYDKKKIVLFYQLNEGFDCKEVEILNSLRGKLSDYMLPNKVVGLSEIPLNPNGKIDRPALKILL